MGDLISRLQGDGVTLWRPDVKMQHRARVPLDQKVTLRGLEWRGRFGARHCVEIVRNESRPANLAASTHCGPAKRAGTQEVAGGGCCVSRAAGQCQAATSARGLQLCRLGAACQPGWLLEHFVLLYGTSDFVSLVKDRWCLPPISICFVNGKGCALLLCTFLSLLMMRCFDFCFLNFSV